MTTVAFKDGVMAADSRFNTDSGITPGTKLFRKVVAKKPHIIGICGDVYSALLFVDWYGTDDKTIQKQLNDLTDDSFEVMLWDGKLLKACNRLLRVSEIEEPYFALGSGAQFAIAAMDCGKSAAQAVQAAIKRDPYSGGKIVTMSLPAKGAK